MKDKHVAIEVSRDEHYRTPYLKSLRENWPSLAKDYRHYCHTYSPATGEIWTWTSPEGQMFFHLVLDDCSIEQPLHLVNATRLQSFKKAIKKLRHLAEAQNLKIVELPKVGFHFSEHELDLAQMMVKKTFLDTQTEVKFV